MFIFPRLALSLSPASEEDVHAISTKLKTAGRALKHGSHRKLELRYAGPLRNISYGGSAPPASPSLLQL
jgi:hypothetical protein